MVSGVKVIIIKGISGEATDLRGISVEGIALRGTFEEAIVAFAGVEDNGERTSSILILYL